MQMVRRLMDVEYLLMLREVERSKDGTLVDLVEGLVVQEEEEQMSTLSILAEMTPPAMMTDQLAVTVIGIVVSAENAVVNVNETRSAWNVDALVLEKGADVPGLVSVKGPLGFRQRKAPADVEKEKEREVVLPPTAERGVETGIERETARGEAEAETERETGREGKVLMGRKKAWAG